MMNFAKELRVRIPTPCFHRPFVCDGGPQECGVIVIGENPATPTEIDWWTFWTDDRGFDLNKFERHYEKSRLAIGKRAVSSTRSRLNYLRAQGLNCLETNVFSNERLKGHGKGGRRNDLLDLFVENLPKLKGVIAHGAIAAGYLDGLALRKGIKRYRMPHFIRTSYTSLHAVIEELK